MSAPMAKVYANVAIFFTVVTSVFWLGLIMQDKGWSSKTCSYYTLDTGAWSVSVSKGLVAKVFVPSKIANAGFFRRFSPSVHTTEDFKEWVCGISNSMPLQSDMCFIAEGLHFSSLGLIAASFFGTFCNCCAACMVAMWAYMKPRESLRLWARILYALTFGLYTGGLAQYASAAARLKDLPPSNEAVTFGRNIMLGGGLCALSLIPLFMVVCLIGRTREEALNEHLSFKHKELREEKRLNDNMALQAGDGYGAASYTTAGGSWEQPASFDQSWVASGYGQSWAGQGAEGGYGAYAGYQMPPGADPSAVQMPDMQQPHGQPMGQPMA